MEEKLELKFMLTSQVEDDVVQKLATYLETSMHKTFIDVRSKKFGEGLDNSSLHLQRSRVRGDVGNSPFSRGRYTIERSRASAAFSGMPEKGQR